MSLTRRDLLRLGAAAAAGPLLPKSVARAAAGAGDTAAAGRFFGAAEMALLDELTETILPADEHSGGARAARVAGYIDDRLAQYDPAIPDRRESRDKWKAGLAALDEAARASCGKGFLEATPAERAAALQPIAAAEKDPKTAAEQFFVELKGWTAYGYYTSSIGIHDEMEYKGNTLLPEFTGTDPADL